MDETTSEEIAQIPPISLQLAHRRIINYLMRQLDYVQRYWQYRYREEIVAVGLNVPTSSNVYVDDNEIRFEITVVLPEKMVFEMAKAMRRRALKLPKQSPRIKQREREPDRVLEEYKFVADYTVKEFGGPKRGEKD